MGWVISSDNYIDLRRFPHDLDPLSIMARGGVTSTSGSLSKVDEKNRRIERLKSKRLVSVLFEWEFRARFHISDNILIQLTDDKALSFTDLPNNMMYFTKEQFTVRLRFPIPSLFK